MQIKREGRASIIIKHSANCAKKRVKITIIAPISRLLAVEDEDSKTDDHCSKHVERICNIVVHSSSIKSYNNCNNVAIVLVLETLLQ